MTVNYTEISKTVRDVVTAMVRAESKDGLVDQFTTVGGGVAAAIALAWRDAVRDEFYRTIEANTKLAGDLKVAKTLMLANHSQDFLCVPPGMEMQWVEVDGKRLPLFDSAMVYAVPVSAVYLDRVVEVTDAIEATEAKDEDSGPEEVD